MGKKEECEVIAQVSEVNVMFGRGVLDSVYLTKQLAESIISLLGLSLPFSSEGHFGGVGVWRRESRDTEAS